MNLAAILDWCDDRLNPIVVKELRQAVKSRMVVGILILFLGLQLFLLGTSLLVREARGQSSAIDWNAGNSIFQVQQGILLWTIMILVPVYASIRLGAERSDHNVDLMFISTLRPTSIIWGKFFAASVLGLLIFSACAPFMTFTYLLRGIDIPTILLVLGIDLLAMTFGIILALLLAALPGSRPVKAFICFLGFVQLAWGCAMLTMGTVAIIMAGNVGDWVAENLGISFSIVLGVLAVSGLMFFYSVALISAPAANRIFPLRVYLFVAWVIVSISLAMITLSMSATYQSIPVGFYILTVPPILCLQLWISICERDHWAPRVARTIPRNPLLRLVAFFFFTGAAGGVVYSVTLLVLSFLGSVLMLESVLTTANEHDGVLALLRGMVLVALYAYCYGMSAVLVRTYLLANQIRSVFNWLIAALLVGLGSSIPSVIAYILFYDQIRYQNEPGWWALPNPFLAVYEVSNSPRTQQLEFEVLCYFFLAIWGVLVTLLSLPWFVGQLKRFRPLVPREIPPADVILVSEPTSVGAG
ncbi:MAG: hypothetical protein U0840_14490 [Gemmataceae bacterium]